MAFKLDLTNIAYLTFRLFPIILPTYFILFSIFSQDIKGLIYLAGLLIACLLALLAGNTLHEIDFLKPWLQGLTSADPTCNQITLTGTSPISKVPLSQAIYAYTLAYFLTIMITHSHQNLVSQNIPTILFLTILIFSDFLWNVMKKCGTILSILISTIFAGCFGIFWAYIIIKSGAAQLQYFNGLSNRAYCTRPSTQTFKCSTAR
jgi:hypothetical protein